MTRTIRFEGRTINVPDDATDDEVRSIIDGSAAPATPASAQPAPAVQVDPALMPVIGAPPTPAAPKAEPSWLDNIFGAVGYAGETGAIMADSARRGASNIAGLPVDLINASPMLLRLFGVDAQPFSEKPIGGSAFMNDLTKGFGAVPDAPEPEDPIQTILSRVAEEVGATAVPGAGILGAAARTSLPAVREAGGMSKYLLEPALVNPANFVGKEVAAATAAGGGAGIANTLVDRDTTGGQFADLLGALGGVGLSAVGSGVGRSLGDVAAAATGNRKYASQVVQENAADTIINNSDVLARTVDPANPNAPIDTTKLIELLQRPAQAETVIPGFNASTADRAGDAGLASLEDARARGPENGAFRTRQNNNTTAIDAELNTVAPSETTPGSIFDALENQRGMQLGDADQQYQDAIAAAERATAPLAVPPGSTTGTRGNVVRTELEAARDAARGRTHDAYAAADIGGVPVDPSDLTAVVDNAVAPLTAVERGLIPESTLERVRALSRPTVDAAGVEVPAGPVDLREATTLRSELGRLQSAALAEPRAEKGGRNAARVLGSLFDAVDDFIARNVSPEQADLEQAARAAKFDEAERFARPGDPVADALARREGGQPKMVDERVAGSFVSPSRHLERLFTEANTDATRTAIREEMLSRLDNSSPESIARFMSTFDDQISRFPGLADELRAAAGARADETVANIRSTELRRLLGTPDGTVPGRNAVAKFLQNDVTQAERAMEGVLSAGKPGATVDELLSFVGDEPRAVEGARRAFWQVMEKRGRSKNAAFETADGIEPWMPKKWRDFLDEPNVAAVAERLYRDNPEHLKKIREIAEALRGVNTAQKAGMATNPSGTAASMRGGAVTLAEAQAKFVDVQRGRLNPLYAITYLAGKMAHRMVSKQAERAYKRLLDEALLNPQVAADLMKANNPANRAALARSAKGWLGNEASHLTELLTGGEPDEQGGDEDKEPIRITVAGGAKKETE